MCIVILITISSIASNQNNIKINLVLTMPLEELLNILETQVNISDEEDFKFVFHLFRKRKEMRKDKKENKKYQFSQLIKTVVYNFGSFLILHLNYYYYSKFFSKENQLKK